MVLFYSIKTIIASLVLLILGYVGYIFLCAMFIDDFLLKIFDSVSVLSEYRDFMSFVVANKKSTDNEVWQKIFRIRKPCRKFSNWRLEMRSVFAWNAVAESWNEDYFKEYILPEVCSKLGLDKEKLKMV